MLANPVKKQVRGAHAPAPMHAFDMAPFRLLGQRLVSLTGHANRAQDVYARAGLLTCIRD